MNRFLVAYNLYQLKVFISRCLHSHMIFILFLVLVRSTTQQVVLMQTTNIVSDSSSN